MRVLASRGSPTGMRSISVVSRSVTSAMADFSTNSICTEVQTCPALRKAALAILGTARSMSASAQTMVLAMLPSSSWVLRNPAAC